MAYFNDSRCAAGGVCSTDPLLFTCELNEVFILRVVLPHGDQEVISLGDTAASVALPVGFTAEALNITNIDENKRKFSLTLYITNASLLNDGQMRCDNASPEIVTVMAGCPLLGKF